MTREQTLERLHEHLQALDEAALTQLLGALEKGDEAAWLGLALGDQQTRLAELEANLSEGEVERWLADLRDASTPVRWDPEKEALVEL